MQHSPTIEDILMMAHQLPPAEQIQLFARMSENIAEMLQKTVQNPPDHSRSLRGLWAHDHASISSEEIDEARQELWGNFPHNDL